MDKIKSENTQCTLRVPLLLDSVNVGTTLGSQGSAMSTIQGDISNINTAVSNLNNNKQNNIPLLAGTNVTIFENPTDT